MFCPKCGKEVPDDAAFCPKCGNKLGNIAKAINDSSKSGKSLYKNRLLLLCIFAILVSGCLFFGFFIFNNTDRHDQDIENNPAIAPAKNIPDIIEPVQADRVQDNKAEDKASEAVSVTNVEESKEGEKNDFNPEELPVKEYSIHWESSGYFDPVFSENRAWVRFVADDEKLHYGVIDNKGYLIYDVKMDDIRNSDFSGVDIGNTRFEAGSSCYYGARNDDAGVVIIDANGKELFNSQDNDSATNFYYVGSGNGIYLIRKNISGFAANNDALIIIDSTGKKIKERQLASNESLFFHTRDNHHAEYYGEGIFRLEYGAYYNSNTDVTIVFNNGENIKSHIHNGKFIIQGAQRNHYAIASVDVLKSYDSCMSFIESATYSSGYLPDKTEYLEDRDMFVFWNSGPFYGDFVDINGNVVVPLEKNKCREIWKVGPDYLVGKFDGADGKKYFGVVDTKGEFIYEPIKIGKYSAGSDTVSKNFAYQREDGSLIAFNGGKQMFPGKDKITGIAPDESTIGFGGGFIIVPVKHNIDSYVSYDGKTTIEVIKDLGNNKAEYIKHLPDVEHASKRIHIETNKTSAVSDESSNLKPQPKPNDETLKKVLKDTGWDTDVYGLGDFDVVVSADDGYVNVRDGAGTEYNKQGSIPNKTVLHVDECYLSSEGKPWGRITQGKFNGYIALSQVSPLDSTSVENNASVNDGDNSIDTYDELVDFLNNYFYNRALQVAIKNIEEKFAISCNNIEYEDAKKGIKYGDDTSTGVYIYFSDSTGRPRIYGVEFDQAIISYHDENCVESIMLSVQNQSGTRLSIAEAKEAYDKLYSAFEKDIGKPQEHSDDSGYIMTKWENKDVILIWLMAWVLNDTADDHNCLLNFNSRTSP